MKNIMHKIKNITLIVLAVMGAQFAFAQVIGTNTTVSGASLDTSSTEVLQQDDAPATTEEVETTLEEAGTQVDQIDTQIKNEPEDMKEQALSDDTTPEQGETPQLQRNDTTEAPTIQLRQKEGNRIQREEPQRNGKRILKYKQNAYFEKIQKQRQELERQKDVLMRMRQKLENKKIPDVVPSQKQTEEEGRVLRQPRGGEAGLPNELKALKQEELEKTDLPEKDAEPKVKEEDLPDDIKRILELQDELDAKLKDAEGYVEKAIEKTDRVVSLPPAKVNEIKKREKIRKEKKKKIVTRARDWKVKGKVKKDSDGDGISDYDEKYIFETDPNNPDTDGDGYVDGAEVLGGFDPKQAGEAAVVVYENPKNVDAVEDGIFALSKIEVVSEPPTASPNDGSPASSDTATAEGDAGTGTSIIDAAQNTSSGKKIILQGKALPNMFVTLYIFSIPTVVTVRADEEGNWQYEMDKELEDGSHEVYMAMTDSTGKIIARSNPIPFVKEANAVTVDERLLAAEIAGIQPSFVNVKYFYIFALVFVLVVGTVVTIIGVRIRISEYRRMEQARRGREGDMEK